jgi:hypothetical protein
MWPAARLEDHWNSAEDRALLAKHWDHVIIQAESAAQLSEPGENSFHEYGGKLISVAHAAHSPIALIVNWAYAAPEYAGLAAGARNSHINTIERDYRRMAAETGAKLINTCWVWESLLATDPQIPLYQDTNHPAVAGSYLSAIMIYAFISGADVAKVTYHPSGMDEKTASTITTAVRRYYSGTNG